MAEFASNFSRAEELCENVCALARQPGSSRSYLLMQVAELLDDKDEHFRQVILEAGIEPVKVKIDKLPARFWPVLIELNLEQSMHSAVSAFAIAMAIADIEPQAMRRGQVQRVCAWIFTDASINELARHIARTAISRHPLSRKNRWLRYDDPAVADLFWRICAPEEQFYFLRGIACWAYINRWQTLEMVRPTAESATPIAMLPVSAWERLEGVGALNQAWVRARCEGVDVIPANFWKAVDAVQQGYRRGVHQRIDLDLFAWQAVHLGPDFYRHHRVQTLLEQVGHGQHYSELAYQLDDAQWHRIALETGKTFALPTQERVSP